MPMDDEYERRTIVGADDYDRMFATGGEPIAVGYGPPGYGPPQGYPPYGYEPPPQLPPPNYNVGAMPHHTRRQVQSQRASRDRKFPIGFNSTAIQPGEERDIEVKPQVLFRGERLAVASDLARNFVIVDIKVGKNSQLAATGEMAAEAFSTLAVGVQMELDTAQPGIVLTVRVRNISGLASDFRAVMHGAVME